MALIKVPTRRLTRLVDNRPHQLGQPGTPPRSRGIHVANVLPNSLGTQELLIKGVVVVGPVSDAVGIAATRNAGQGCLRKTKGSSLKGSENKLELRF
jgi:hypothetical protein